MLTLDLFDQETRKSSAEDLSIKFRTTLSDSPTHKNDAKWKAHSSVLFLVP
jgi:hypothetical protein